MKFLCPTPTHLTRPALYLVYNMYLYFKDSYVFYFSPQTWSTEDVGQGMDREEECNSKPIQPNTGSSNKYWWEIKYMLHPIAIPPLGNPLYQCITFLWFYIYILVYLPD